MDKLPDEKCKELLEYKAKVNCEMCDLKGKGCCITCTYNLIKQFLEIFNRLQADCENYKQVAENQQKITLDRGFEIKELKAEIERLKKGWKADILLTQNTKVEAYKEFAEKLKTIMYENYQKNDEQPYPMATINIICNLLKELVGDE